MIYDPHHKRSDNLTDEQHRQIDENINIEILRSLILHLRNKGVKINSPYDFENWIEDHASHAQMMETKLFYQEENPCPK